MAHKSVEQLQPTCPTPRCRKAAIKRIMAYERLRLNGDIFFRGSEPLRNLIISPRVFCFLTFVLSLVKLIIPRNFKPLKRMTSVKLSEPLRVSLLSKSLCVSYWQFMNFSFLGEVIKKCILTLELSNR